MALSILFRLVFGSAVHKLQASLTPTLSFARLGRIAANYLAVLCLLLNNLDGFVVLLFDLLVFCLQLLDLLNEFVCGLARFFYLLLKRCYLLRHLLLGFFHFLFDDLLLRHLLSLVDPFPLLVVCANESFHIVLELYQLFSVLDQFKLTVLFQLVPHFLRLVLDVLHLVTK